MNLPDTAEYWWDVKRRSPYCGKTFMHNQNHKCNHYNPLSGNTATTIYIGDINCYECIENIKNGTASTEGLLEGNAPATFYMSRSEKKKHNARQRFIEIHGKCPCGSHWQIRKNRITGQQFFGCVNYPSCKNTKSIQK